MARNVAVLAGDGIGPEVIAEAIKVLEATGSSFEFNHALVGGAAYDACGVLLAAGDVGALSQVRRGAAGGSGRSQVRLNPTAGTSSRGRRAVAAAPKRIGHLRKRSPGQDFKVALIKNSPLKTSRSGVDLVVIRELTGGIYFCAAS